MHASAPVDACDASIAARAQRFELPALLRVLRRRGYADEAVWFESVGNGPKSSGIIHSLRFEEQPRRAIVRLNAGLLGTNGPLPSYFRRFADELADKRPLLAFLRFFDHVLLASRSYVAHPADGVARDSPLPRAYQIIGGARSPGRVHALIRAIVPELPLEVFPATLTRREPNEPARLGEARLDGTAVVGWSHRTAVAGLVARLSAEEEHDDRGRRWAEVVHDRCRHSLVPLVRRGAHPIEIRLRVDSYAGRARLERRPQLGVEPVTTGNTARWEVTVMRLAGRGADA